MASKVTPSTPGAPSFCLAISYAARSVSVLQTWTYRPQKRQDGSAFALTYILRLRSCKSMDAFVISSLPSPWLEALQMAGPLRSADITPPHRYYGPGRHPLVFGRLPGVAGYTAYLAPAISRWGEEGFSSCSACPCRRAVASTPPKWSRRIGQISATHAAFTLSVAGSAFGASHFRGHLYVHFHYGPMTRASPTETPVDRLQKFGFPPPCYPSYGASDSCPGRFVSC